MKIKKLSFTKMVASGNDFVVIKNSQGKTPPFKSLAREVCHRKFGVGADGLLVLEKSMVADIRMRVFNADGSEAEMCGNGARCAAFYIGKKRSRIETRAGIIFSEIQGKNVKIRLTDPKGTRLNIPIRINNLPLKVNFINTGVPHTVILAESVDKIDVANLGRVVRQHSQFKPAGTNVDFVEALSNNAIKIRTYERGVEDETLACGTGSVASALIFALKTGVNKMIKVHTRSKEVLTVYFGRFGDKFTDVWLEGKARIVYRGVYNV